MVGLQADSQYAPLPHGVAAARNHSNLGGRQYQVFVAHDLSYCRGHLGSNGPVQLPEAGFFSLIAEDEFAELADRHAPDGRESIGIMTFQDEPGYIVKI